MRIPVVPTIIVGLAVAAMVALGIWQLDRAAWKADLLEQYAANQEMPAMAFPKVPVLSDNLLYRRARGDCLSVASWSARAGQNQAGESGWRHIGVCRTGDGKGPGMAVDFGWSKNSADPVGYEGGPVEGFIDTDRDHVYLLVAETPAPGLEPSARPDPRAVPNNHLAYAGQWFLFAGVALIIYIVALRRLGTSGRGSSGRQPLDGCE